MARAVVARVVAAVLRDPDRHRGITYDLTGPEGLDFSTIADMLGAHSGMSIRYHNETIAEAYESRKKWDAPGWQYDAWVSTYTAIATGTLAAITDHVHAITGRHPMTLAEYRGQRSHRQLPHICGWNFLRARMLCQIKMKYVVQLLFWLRVHCDNGAYPGYRPQLRTRPETARQHLDRRLLRTSEPIPSPRATGPISRAARPKPKFPLVC